MLKILIYKFGRETRNNVNEIQTSLNVDAGSARCSNIMLMLGITALHNGMILSTVSISSRGFALGLPKTPRTNEDSIP